MDYPPWIDKPRSSPLVRAQLRLKYRLSAAALRRYGRTSMHDLAREIGCNHSSIFNAINRGYFTQSMAEAIEKVLGKEHCPKEALIDPLNEGQVTA